MMIRITRRAFAFFLALACTGVSIGQDILITEFMSRRSNSIRDDDGDRAEFIELYNAGTSAEDLGGYFLGDDCINPLRWSFPDGVIIGPTEFLVVWVTEKDRRDPCCDLHTNFRLDGEGECLVLSDPFGEQLHIYPFFPEQVLGYSYGVPMSGLEFLFMGANTPCTATVPGPSNPVEGLDWTQPDYDDSAWLTGTTGIGFDSAPDYLPLLGLDIGEEMLNNNATCYVRIPFQVDDASDILRLEFAIKYEDGFIAYLNGTRVVSDHAPDVLTSTSSATRFRSDSKAQEFRVMPFDEGTPTLRTGENILAIHGLNETIDSSDFLIFPRLEGFARGTIERAVRSFFATPTPGEPNAPGGPDLSATPVLSDPSGAYPSGSLSVTVSMEVPVEGTVIRFALDGETPDESSPIYTGPIDINSDTLLTARAYQPGLAASLPVAGHYVSLGEDMLDFSSPIPVVVCSTFGREVPEVCSTGPYTFGRFLLFTPGDDGRAHLMDDAHFAHRVGFRRRGNPCCTCLSRKFYFNVEFRDRDDQDQDVELFNFAPHADYAMFAPLAIDQSFIRNPLAYWMSREMGHWAPQTQLVECFLHRPGQQELTMDSYWGVYMFTERIETGLGRVDVDRLGPRDNSVPAVTGGYVLQRDRTKEGDVAIDAGGFSSIIFTCPRSPTADQKIYMRNYINTAVASLNPNIAHQDDSDLIDVRSWIDYHILKLYPKEVDAFVFSAYMHKPRNGLLVAGPIWDYDRSMGARDSRVEDPLTWDAPGFQGTRMFERSYSWYGHLFDDEPPLGESPWARAYRARWREVRGGPLSTENINTQIDEWVADLLEPAERNWERWPGVVPGGYPVLIDELKSWLQTRAEWMDQQFAGIDPEAPTFSLASGLIEPGTQVEISAESGDIFYTLNGPDPFLPTTQAIAYSGPITITTHTRIRAHARVGTLRSDTAEARYMTAEPSLVVTEIMYNPKALQGDPFVRAAYEFIELYNPSDKATSLGGVILDAPRFEFPFDGDVTTLGPREYVVLVRNVEAFRSRYGTEGILIGGELFGFLVNSSQDIVLSDISRREFIDFSYQSSWHPSTDGQGRSLVIRSPTAPPESWNNAASWRPSLEDGGSPGRDDTEIVLNHRRQGDLNGSGSLEISDAILLVLNLFGQREQPCSTAEDTTVLLDVDGDGVLTQNDALHVLFYLFLEGPPPERGLDCTPIPGCPEACL